MTKNEAIELAKEDMYNRYGDELSHIWNKKRREALHNQYEEAITILDGLKDIIIVTDCISYNNDTVESLRLERDVLCKQLDVAKEALSNIVKGVSAAYPSNGILRSYDLITAQDALTKIEGKQNE